jgi:hypothetical protein
MMKRCAMLALLALAAPACSDDGGGAVDAGPPDAAPVPLAWETVVTDYQPGALLSGWAPAPDDVWAVGGEQGKSVVLHFDGTSWETMDPGLNEQLWWIHGFEGGPVYVAGDHGAIARWDGAAWEIMETGAPGTVLFGIWGAAPDDMWAVGGPTQVRVTGVEPEGDMVLHYDGTAWQRVEIQALIDKPASQGDNLFKIWGTDANTVFIVGDSGLALHYDGAEWTQVPTPATGAPLFTVTGRSATDVYAVGGLLAAILVHWDGTAWSEVEMPVAPGVTQGVWTAPGEPLYIGGYYGFTAALSDEGAWNVVDTRSQLAYHAVFGDGSGAMWAVGGDIYSQLPDYVGVIISTHPDVPAP